MSEESKAVKFVWGYAEFLANKYGLDFINEDCLFIGIFSLDKGLDTNTSKKYIYIKSEYVEIQDILNNFNLEFKVLRDGLTELLEKDAFQNVMGLYQISESCEKILNQANYLASDDDSEVRCIHLLKSILFNPTDNIKTLFNNLDIDINDFTKELDVTNNPPKIEVEDDENEENFSIQDFSNTLLGKYGKNITQLANENKLKPVIGREKELFELERTLNKLNKNNALIIGEAGVGKTALVNALAINIANGNVNDALKDKIIFEISVSSLVSGTGLRGSFEEKLEEILKEVKENPNIILFIDEIHTLLGSGRVSDGGLDGSNILKPALSNGDLTLIGATTFREYRRYFEKDSAFERRFQPIMLNEPTEKEAIMILNGLKETYENHYNLKITDEAVNEAVHLSVRYMVDRNLPDKALDVIDEACSRKVISNPVYGSEDSQHNLYGDDVKDTVSELTGIPIVSKSTEFEKVKNLESFLKANVVGQDEAITKISNKIKRSTVGIQDPKRPLAVFYFLGNTGVGKTYISKLLAEYLFGDEKFLIRLDMSEYKEKHSVSKLIGAAPGLVGHEDGAYLTDSIRNKPYSIVLIDEFDKADSEVRDIFLQVFDEGRLTDSKGNTINAKNCIFIMTSNYIVGKQGLELNSESLLENFKNHFNFRPEFVNRIDEIIMFNDLGDSDYGGLVKISLEKIAERLLNDKNVTLKFDSNIIDYLTNIKFDRAYGARYLNRAIEDVIETPITDLILDNKLHNNDTLSLHVFNNELKFKVN